MNKAVLQKIILDKKPILTKKYHIKTIGIFGSVARNESSEQSDVDILVEFDSPIGFFEFVRLEEFLSKSLNRKVDLVSKKALKASIKDDILKEVFYV